MTQSFLVTTLIILAEVILALLAILYIAIRRYFKLKAIIREKTTGDNIQPTSGPESTALIDYLTTEIDRTLQRIKLAEKSEQGIPLAPLKRRLELLLSERQVTVLAKENDDNNKFWGIVNAHYEVNTQPIEETEPVADTSQQDGEKIIALQTQLEEMRNYKDLSDQHSEQLLKANKTISELELSITNSSFEENSLLLATIEGLKDEKNELQSTLDRLSKSASVDNAAKVDPREFDSIQKELRIYKDLVNQADKKLKNSIATVNDLKSIIKDSDSTDKITQMERAIDTLGTENQSLKERLDQTLRPDLAHTQNLLTQQEKAEELSMYMDLVLQANKKLKQTNETVTELRNIIDNSAPSDELSQMEDMVDKLSKDNLVLLSQLNDLTEAKRSAAQDNPNEDKQAVDLKDDELNKYIKMIADTNEKLNESNTTIDELKKLISQSPAISELEQMESMIETISQDNNGLRQQLNNIKESSNEKIKAIENESQQKQEALREELSMYVDLVNQANDKLKESKATIDELRTIVKTSVNAEEISQMEDMLDKLSLDNKHLEQQLHSVNNQLQKTLTNIKALELSDSEHLKQLTILKDEKWFLEEQIKHLMHRDQ